MRNFPLHGLLLLAALVAAAPASAAQLWTLDGKTHEGDLALNSDATLTLTPATGKPLTIPLDQLLYAAFNPPKLGEGTTPTPSPLQPRQIGKPRKPGTIKFTHGLFTFTSSASDLAGNADTAEFFQQKLEGNGELVARIIQISAGTPNAHTGLMFRNSVDPNARFAAIAIAATGQVDFRFRTTDNAPITTIPGFKTQFPVWLKLVRQDRQFVGYTSQDRKTWTLIGRAYPEGAFAKPHKEGKWKGPPPLGIEMRSNPYAGVLLTSGSDELTAAATLDQFAAREQPREGSAPKPDAASARIVSLPLELTAKGMLTRNGTFIADASVQSIEKSTVRFTRANATPFAANVSQISRITFQPLSAGLLSRIPPKTTGVLLNNGDFMEGEINAIADGKVRISSVLFGLATHPLGDVRAIVFGPPEPLETAFRVHLTDGSVLMARAIKPDAKGNLVVDEQSIGAVTLPLRDIYLLHAGTRRSVPLTDLKPAKVETPEDRELESSSLFDPVRAPWMNTAGTLSERGLVAPGATAVTYTLDGEYRHFVCRIGVPEPLPTKAAVRFIVLADGRERYKSPPRSSQDPPVVVSVALQGAKTLVLRTEPVGEPDLPAYGLWGDPVLSR